MQSSAFGSLRSRASAWLTALVVAALALALLFAFASKRLSPPPPGEATTQAPESVPVASAAPAPDSSAQKPAMLWKRLTPFALAIDGIAILGLGAGLLVRRR